MLLQDILPITSISLIVLGFAIILIGTILLAKHISSNTLIYDSPSTEDIIGEMNQMFTYFTDKINSKDDFTNKKRDVGYNLTNEHYLEVLELKKQGKESDQIAKELNMGKGEVNLILGIDQMR